MAEQAEGRIVLYQDNSPLGEQMRQMLTQRGVSFVERPAPSVPGIPQVAYCGDICHNVEEAEKLVNRLPQYP